MLQPPLHGDRVEALADFVESAGDGDVVLAAEGPLEDGGSGEEAEPRLPEHGEQRAVLDLGDDVRPELVRGAPLVERAPKGRSRRGEQKGRVRQRTREAPADRPDARYMELRRGTRGSVTRLRRGPAARPIGRVT